MAVAALQAPAARATAAASAPVAQVPVEPPGPPPPEVQATVQGILDSGRHPLLAWPHITGDLPALKTLYAAEPDGLFWFAGDVSHPALLQASGARAGSSRNFALEKPWRYASRAGGGPI